MPRRDWNTPTAHGRKPHHKHMHSARKGSGHDAKIRKAKRLLGDRRGRCPICGWPTVDVSRHKRANHRN